MGYDDALEVGEFVAVGDCIDDMSCKIADTVINKISIDIYSSYFT
jgi:hypothetical protein